MGKRIRAFDLDCGAEGAECSPVWGRPTGKPSESPPIVVDGSVYYVSDRLDAFQP